MTDTWFSLLLFEISSDIFISKIRPSRPYVVKVKTEVQTSKTITYCNEVTFQPVIIFHCFINSSIFPLYFHFGMVNIWILSRRVISPDNAILDILSSHTNFQSNLVWSEGEESAHAILTISNMFQLNALLYIQLARWNLKIPTYLRFSSVVIQTS